jgi:hypothetical protein
MQKGPQMPRPVSAKTSSSVSMMEHMELDGACPWQRQVRSNAASPNSFGNSIMAAM